MLNKIGTSWSLIKSSARVLQSDKELVLFPIISTLAMIALSAVFFVPMILVGFFNTLASRGLQWADYLVLFIFYLLQYFIVFMSNTALVGAAMIRIRGGDPTVKDGLKIASDRIVSIFLYSLIAATVGLLLSMIKNKGNTIARIVVSLVGLVWNVATFLVVPILAVEDVGPIQAIKNSVSHLKRTWGEQLVGSFSISAVFDLITFAVIFGAFGAGIFAWRLGQPAWVLFTIVAVAIFLLLVISLVSSTLTGIYTAAVYQYAVTGDAGTFYDSGAIQDAFHQEKKF